MNSKILLAIVAITAAFDWNAQAQTYDTNGIVVQTFAGSGFSGCVDGVGQLTMFDYPTAIVADSHGNLFVWDFNNFRVRRIGQDATVSTFAGGGGQTTGVGTNVGFANWAFDMTIDRSDTIWLGTYNGGSTYLYKITSGATISRTEFPNFHPTRICADSQGNLYFSGNDNRIYRYTTNSVLSVFAGSGNVGSSDGNGIFTSFNGPSALAADAADNIYVWDFGNRLVRRIDQNQNVATIAGHYPSASADGVGTNAGFESVSGICTDSFGSIILACGTAVRRVSASTNVITIAGNFTQGGYANGAGNLARFLAASGVCISGGTIYVADSGNHRIRSITNNPTEQPVQPANLRLDTYPGLRITGTVGRAYRVESSPDMTNWTSRATLLLNTSPHLWIDQNSLSGNRFYRALLLP